MRIVLQQSVNPTAYQAYLHARDTNCEAVDEQKGCETDAGTSPSTTAAATSPSILTLSLHHCNLCGAKVAEHPLTSPLSVSASVSFATAGSTTATVTVEGAVHVPQPNELEAQSAVAAPSAPLTSHHFPNLRDTISEQLPSDSIAKRKLVLALAILVILAFGAGLVGAVFGSEYLFHNMRFIDFDPMPGSSLERTEQRIFWHTTKQVLVNPVFIVVESVNPMHSTLSDDLFYFGLALQNELANNPRYRFLVCDLQGYFMTNFRQEIYVAGRFNESSLIVLGYRSGSYDPFTETLEDFIMAQPIARNGHYQVRVTGMIQMLHATSTSVARDMAHIDEVSLPFAFVLLAICVRSIRVTFLTLFILPFAVILAMGVFAPMTKAMRVSSFAPEMMSATVIALSIDYSLFIFSRLREVRIEHPEFDRYHVIRRTMYHTAHNIIVSGVAIAASFATLATIKNDFVRSVSVGSSFGAMVAMVVSMTLTPALIYVLYTPIASSFGCSMAVRNSLRKALQNLLQWRRERRERKKSGISNSSMNTIADELPFPLKHKPSSFVAQNEQRNAALENSVWYRMSKFAYDHPMLILFVAACIGTPFFVLVSRMEYDSNAYAEVPVYSPYTVAFRGLFPTFGSKPLNPFTILIDTKVKDGAMSQRTFDTVTAILHFAAAHLALQYESDFLSPTIVGGRTITWNESRALLTDMTSPYYTQWSLSVNADNQMVVVSLYPPFDSYGAENTHFMTRLEHVVDAMSIRFPEIFIGFFGPNANGWSIMRSVTSQFHKQIYITLTTIFVMILLVFRSVFVAVRFMVCLTYTVGVSYGLAVAVFQYQWSHVMWTSLDGTSALMWLVPVLTFSLMCALSLDYDVFILSRVVEFCKMDCDKERAITYAVGKSGRIISFAACIMSIAFGSLMLANTVMLKQFGFCATATVLVDAFLVRPLLVPALVSICPDWLVWWPRKFSSATLLSTVNRESV